MAANTSVRLLKRFQKVLQEWPVDSSRKGRDLGEYLKDHYSLQFKELIDTDVSKAKVAVESLEKLNKDYYMQRYHRDQNYGFSGEVVVKNPWILSNEHIKETPSAWSRLRNKLSKSS